MDPSKREIKPLDTVEEVLKWTVPSGGGDQFTQYKRSQFYLPGDLWANSDRSWETLVSLPLKRDDCSRPKTLVCHGKSFIDHFTHHSRSEIISHVCPFLLRHDGRIPSR